MKAFAAHVKEFRIEHDKRYGHIGKTKWVKVVLQIPTSVRRVAQGIANRLARHMDSDDPNRYLLVIDPQGPEMAVVRAAAAYVACVDGADPGVAGGPSEAENLLVRLRVAARALRTEPVLR